MHALHNVETALGFTEVSCTVPSSPMCERPCGACSRQDAADAAACGQIRQLVACYERCEVAAAAESRDAASRAAVAAMSLERRPAAGMRLEDAALGVRRVPALGQLPCQTMLERKFDSIRPRDLCSVPTFAALAWNGGVRGLGGQVAQQP